MGGVGGKRIITGGEGVGGAAGSSLKSRGGCVCRAVVVPPFVERLLVSVLGWCQSVIAERCFSFFVTPGVRVDLSRGWCIRGWR